MEMKCIELSSKMFFLQRYHLVIKCKITKLISKGCGYGKTGCGF